MGGSGGSGSYSGVKREDLTKAVDQAYSEFSVSFLPSLQKILDEKLSKFNDRDSDIINQRQDEICQALEDTLETSWKLSFGGSVAKHTYVDGLSDVDTLLILKDGNAENLPPDDIRDQVAKSLSDALPGTEVTQGKIAITVTYNDGMEIQLIPAVKSDTGYKVPSWTGERWSNIDPQSFKTALTKRNEACNRSLVPTIKLAKAIIATWPESVQLSGYHVESMAIQAFKGYTGSKTVEAMLPHLFKSSADVVNSPIRDKTGQSYNVDTYLGKSGSLERQKASHWLSQTAKKMDQASIQGSISQWTELFDE